jgi:hypothetical protein
MGVPRFTDEQLRQDVRAGLSGAEIARKYGVAPQSVHERLQRMGLAKAAMVTAPAETERFVQGSLNAMAQLTRSLSRVNKLQDACDGYLTDPNDPERYDVGPHAHDIKVRYDVEVSLPDGKFRTERRVKPLPELLDVLEHDEDGARIVCNSLRGEFKHKDPRQLILDTAQETRATIQTAADLARSLADMKAMIAFREALLAAISQVDQDVARRIAEAVQRTTVLRGVVDDIKPVVAS